MTTTEYGIVSDVARGADWFLIGNGNFTQIRRSASAQWANKVSTTTGLTYGYFGGAAWNGTAWTTVADGTVALTDDATNYVERTVAGVVSDNTSGFTASSLPMAQVTTSGGEITAIVDLRMPALYAFAASAITSGTIATARMASSNDAGNSGSSKTIDWATATSQKVTLTDNCTFTFSNPVAGATYVLRIHQDGTGGRTVTWPSAVHWSGGAAPTLTTTLNKVDVFAFHYDGSTFFAVTSGLNFTA